VRLVFMGTPDFAVASLTALGEAGHDIVAVYSQPPRPAGRGLAERPSPVQALSLKRGLEVRTPLSLKSTVAQDRFAALAADAAVVVAYGLLLPPPILRATRLGCFNIHASLLPRWRGAAPINRAIMAGDKETGVAIMRMDEGLDTGPVCRSARLAITPEMTAGQLHDRLAAMGAALMVETLAGEVACIPQPAEGVSYARKIDKAETRIVFHRPAAEVRNHIHGLSPYPGAWFATKGTRVKVLSCEVVEGDGQPGTVLDDKLTVACGNAAIRLVRLQRDGKGPMAAAEFLRGFAVEPGTVLD
jgi:methionyl-tRNA formyltransferase